MENTTGVSESEDRENKTRIRRTRKSIFAAFKIGWMLWDLIQDLIA